MGKLLKGKCQIQELSVMKTGKNGKKYSLMLPALHWGMARSIREFYVIEQDLCGQTELKIGYAGAYEAFLQILFQLL